MGQDHRLQLQRLELKYIVKPDVALAIRNFVSSYLEIDEFGATRPNLSYPVHSLYLDSDDLRIYWGTINGNKNRYKLRIRFYDDRPNSPVFFEIKRRMNDAILKQRAAVRREAADLILSGQLPDRAHMISTEPRHWVALQNFSRLMLDSRAKPKAHVAYLREAWISPSDNSVRVTLDRDVCCAARSTASFDTQLTEPEVVFGSNVVLELKFTGRFPDWFRELVRVFGLAQCSAAKYADGVALLGEQRVSAQFACNDAHRENERYLARKQSLERLRAAGLIAGKSLA